MKKVITLQNAATAATAIGGLAATACHISTMTATAMSSTATSGGGTIVFTTVKATLLSKVIAGTIGVAAVAAVSYYVYKKLEKPITE